MKKTHLFILILSAIGLVFINYLITSNLIEEQNDHEKHQPMPLIYQMSFMQHFSTKLYFAGIEENWELADLYSHELEEIAEEIVEEDVEYDGNDISKLTEAMLISQIELVEDAIDAKDLPTFKRNYQTLINSCNACHAATGHSAIKITVPTVNPYNQDFSISDQ
ncbi:MAG: hypothetical protein WC967_09750 [Balneolaceae bacterium]